MANRLSRSAAERGFGFGLGFYVRTAADKMEPGSRVGEYGWGGTLGTTFWISPKDDLFVIVMQQLMPHDPPLEGTLKPLLYAAVQEPKK